MYDIESPQLLLDSSVLGESNSSSLDSLNVEKNQSGQLFHRPNLEFFKGINFGGETFVVQGNRWTAFESLKQANADEFQGVERDWGIRPLSDSTSHVLGTGIRAIQKAVVLHE